MMKAIASVAFGVVAASLIATGASAQATLNSVKQKGFLTCGSSSGSIGFGIPDAQGNWTGLDVDFCRAIAAAIFDDPTKVRFIPLDAKDRFTALQAGEVDVLSRNSTTPCRATPSLASTSQPSPTSTARASWSARSSASSSAKELNGKSICTQQGTTTELNLADYFRANNMKYQAVLFATADEAKKAYDAGRCDAFTTDVSGLYVARSWVSNPDEDLILPEIISKEPLGPAVRHGDNQWGDIVRWTHKAMLNAEELGVTKANVEQMKTSENPEIKRLLGTEGKFGEAIGLTNDWAVRIIKHVGNYGESLRAQRRRRLQAEDQARSERALDQGRPAIRPPDPLAWQEHQSAKFRETTHIASMTHPGPCNRSDAASAYGVLRKVPKQPYVGSAPCRFCLLANHLAATSAVVDAILW